MANQTLELVRANLKDVSPRYLTGHEKKLEKVLGRKVISRTIEMEDAELIDTLKRNDFLYWVDTEFALKFKYHACATVGGLGIVGELGRDGRMKKCCTYSGDIPESVLDRLILYRKIVEKHDVDHGLFHMIVPVSIHSLNPLPIVMVDYLNKLDPVMIGWIRYNPLFNYGKKRTWQVEHPTIGVVIAIWDRDKEISVLEG